MRALALSLALAGCAAGGDGLTVVHVTAAMPIDGVATLSIEIDDGVHTVREQLGVGSISLPPERTFSIDTPDGLDESLTVTVTAIDAGSLRLAGGSATTRTLSGRRADVTVTLEPVRGPPLPALPVPAPPSLTVVAGQRGGPGYADSIGADARFRGPGGVACDPTLRVCWIADTDNHVVRRLALDTGQVDIVAGQLGVAKHQAGVLGDNAVHSPTGLAYDAVNAVLYIVERDEHCVASLTNGRLDLFLGMPGMPGDVSGSFIAALLTSPEGIVMAGGGSYAMYVTSTGSHTIHQVTTSFFGPVTTIVGGQPNTPGYAEAAAMGATSLWSSPRGLALSGTTLVVADTGNHRLRTIDVTTGITATIAGGDAAGGDDGAPGTLDAPIGLVLGGTRVFVTDTGVLRAIDLTNLAAGLSTVAGTYGQPGVLDGAGADARFGGPRGLGVVGTQLVVADPPADAVRVVETAASPATVTTAAGLASHAGALDGVGEAAAFTGPRSVVTDGAGVAFVADTGNAAVRRVDLATQAVTTLAGRLGVHDHADGSAADARFDDPVGLTYDGSGALYVVEERGSVVRRVDAVTGETTTIAGGYQLADHVDDLGAAARFDRPLRGALDGGRLYVIEGGATLRAVELVDPSHPVSTVTGAAGDPGYVDGSLAAARFAEPTGLVADGSGKLYIAERGSTIRIVDLGLGVVFTLAGGYQQPGHVDSCGVTARFGAIDGLDLDYEGARLLVADGGLLRRVQLTDACATTLAGVEGRFAVQPGTWPASLNHPSGLARLPDGALLVLDDAENVLLGLAR